MKFPPSYNPSLYEDKIYRLWEKSGFFNPDNLRRTTQSNASLTQNNAELKTFSIAMPPANATGELHIGHAMFLTIQDLLTRWRRMKGDVTLWLPGTDHASIATQARVEKNLLKTEGKTRHSLGRENFLKIVNDFAEKSRQTIRKQIRKMGSSCDWSRERYTLDSGLTKAVQEIFIRMYNDGLIYRGERIVNWCPRCESTLADDEVEYREKQGRLYYIIYKLKVQVKSSKLLKFKNYIVVATTRPETMFGDTAVAVNPQDKRYKHLIGQKAILPLTGRELTIIADKSIDAKFGTGAVKVTPCHDQQDFEIGQRHNLEKIKIFTNNGRLNQSVPTAYQNLERFKARRLILEDLEKLSLLEKTEIYKHNLGYCYRCDAVIEPMVSKQWFVNVNKKLKVKSEKLKVVVGNNNASLKEIALAVVKKGEIKIIPKRFEKIYFHWMENLRDWCISRQIWFGHRMPVWYLKNLKSKISNLSVSQAGLKSTSQISKLNNINLVLARHGETDWNKKDLWQSFTDIPLNQKGQKQAEMLAQKLRNENFDLIITSPLKRAKATAKIIAGEKIPIIEDKSLTERNLGKFEGLAFEEIKKLYPKIKFYPNYNARLIPTIPNGESLKDLKNRAQKVAQNIQTKYQNKKILIVSHSVFLEMLYSVLAKREYQGCVGQFSQTGHWEKVDLHFQKTNELLLFDTQELIKVQAQAPGPDWEQDTDTLDTWFSSGLWTFSTLGWPDTIKNLKFKIKNYNDYLKANDLERFHPTSVLETSYDILFFWVARMILLTTYALGEVPFKTVYLHGLVRDKLGRKMSKSLGNGIDPLDMIKKYGADAVRLSLIIGITPGNDTKMYEEKIAGYRNFVNKIWNIARYIITTPKTKNQKPQTRLTACPYRRVGQVKNAKYQNNNLTIKQFSNRTISLADKWILFELGELIKRVNRNLEAYQFSRAGEDIYEFIWHKLADWYIEIVKIEQLPRQQKILEYVLEKCLIMLHPFVPYVTEKIWSNVKCQMPARQAGGSNVKTTSQISNLKESLLMIQPWVHKIDFQVSEYGADDFIKIQEIITAIRNARAKHKTGAKEIMDYSFFAKQTKNKKNDLEQIIQNSEIIIEKLARVRLVLDDEANFVKSKNLKINLPFAVIHLNTDIKKSATRQSKNEKEKSRQYIQILKVRLNNPNFLTKAPKEIVSKIKENLRQAKLSVR